MKIPVTLSAIVALSVLALVVATVLVVLRWNSPLKRSWIYETIFVIMIVLSVVWPIYALRSTPDWMAALFIASWVWLFAIVIESPRDEQPPWPEFISYQPKFYFYLLAVLSTVSAVTMCALQSKF